MNKITVSNYYYVLLLCTVVCVMLLLYSCTSVSSVAVSDDSEPVTVDATSITLESESSVLQNIYPQYPRKIIDMYLSMSVRQRIAQLMMIRLQYPDGQWIHTVDAHVVTHLNNIQPGGILLFSGNVRNATQLTTLIADIKEQLPITPFIAVDVEGGEVNRLRGISQSIFSNMPDARTMSKTKTAEETYRYMYSVGRSLHALGINMDLAPVADVRYPTTHDFLQRRIFGNTAEETAMYVSASMRGLQEGQVIAVFKHFPGHGSVAVDTHTNLATVNVPLSDIIQKDWLPYTTAMQHGLQAVMLGHLVIPSIDTTIATASSKVVEILRKQIGFSGLIMTDSLDMGAVQESNETFFEGAALHAGVDIILGSVKVKSVLSQLVQLLKSGTLDSTKIEQAVLRVLYTKYNNGLL